MAEVGAVPGPRGRAPSMADVAALAGVSHQTVSRVLNDSPLVKDDTRARVLAAIEEMGYRRNNAARMLATNRSGRIGMISAHLALHGPSMIAVAVQEAGHEAGYDVSLVGVSDFSPESLQGAVDRLLDEAVEALVIAVAHRSATERVLSLDLSVPGRPRPGRHGRPAHGLRDRPGPRGAPGDRAPARPRAPPRRPRHRPADWVEAGQRREGWQQAHADRGLLPGPELAGDWSARSGYEAGQRIADDAERDRRVRRQRRHGARRAPRLPRARRRGARRGERGRLRRRAGGGVLLAAGSPPSARSSPCSGAAPSTSPCGRSRGEAAPSDALIEPRLVVRGSTAAAPGAGAR